jgi:radical SAM superfamily enzyme YgiQ (UPF0313 family)
MNIILAYLVINSPQDTRYNYGLGYVASVLKKNGYDVTYIPLKTTEDMALFYDQARRLKPRIIGFSATTSQFNYLHDISRKIKEESQAFIVCGGIHPTLEPGCLYDIPELDAVVRGEGEFAMLELADALRDNKPVNGIRNIWVKESGRTQKNELRPLISRLDELPFPDKESLDYQRVIDDSRGLDRFIFSRGCAFSCAYCSNKALSDLYRDSGPYLRTESPERAVEEIRRDASRYRFSEVCFDDDIISLNKKWFYGFFGLYRKEFKYPFLCNIRPNTVDEDMIRILKDAGIKMAVVGIEHGNEPFRRTVLKRDITDSQIKETFRLFKKYNIAYTGQIMVGFPFENKRLFLDTVRLCRELDIRPPQNISVFYPYPGTALGRLCAENGWMPEKRFYRERSEAVISYPTFSKKEIRLCTRAFSILLGNKNISLKMPLNLVRYYHKWFGKEPIWNTWTARLKKRER